MAVLDHSAIDINLVEGRECISTIISITVPPEFSEKLQDSVAITGDSVVLTCCAKGIPNPTYKWSKNGDTLDKNPKTKKEDNSTTLQLSNVGSADEGLYEVVATNVAGEAKTTCQLMIHGE